MNKYLTIAELSEQADLSNSTCRRYLSTFESFFMVKGGNRVRKYEAGAVGVLMRIKALYDEGLETNEIHNILVTEFAMVVNDGEEVENENQVPTLATSEDIAEIKQALEEQKQFNIMLLERLDQQNKYITESLERRDKALLQAIRESQQAKLETAATKKEGFFKRLFGKK